MQKSKWNQAQMVKNLPAMRETQVQCLGRKDPLEKGMATHSNILAWKIPWTEEPGGLQSMGSQRVRHDRATKHACIPLRGESYSFLLNSPCWVNHSVSLDYSYLICKMMTKPNRLCCYED